MRTSNAFLFGAALAGLTLTIGLRADDKPPAAKLEQKEAGATSITEIEGKDLKRWIYETNNEDPSVREKAIRAIVAFGPNASTAEVMKALVDRCTDVEASPRVRAVIALSLLDIQEIDRTKVVEALAKRIDGHAGPDGQMVYDDPQGIVRYHAALALTRFDEKDGKAAIPALTHVLKDRSSFETRKTAIVALRHIGRDAKNGPDARVTNALLERLTAGAEPAAEVKLEAIITLGSMGRPADQQLLTKVENLLTIYTASRDPILSIWAHYGVMAHKEVTEAHLAAIAKHTTSPDVVTRIHCVQCLGAMGSKAKTHIGGVIKMLQDKDDEVYSAACMALASIGEPPDLAFKALTDIAEAKDDAVPKPDPGRKAVAKYALEVMKHKDKPEMKDEKKDKEMRKDKEMKKDK